MLGTPEQASEIIHYMLDRGLFPQIVRVSTDERGNKLPEGKYAYGFSISFSHVVGYDATDHIADLCEKFGLYKEVSIQTTLEGPNAVNHILYRFS